MRPPLFPTTFKDESGLALFMTIVTLAFLVILVLQFVRFTRTTAQETAHFRDGIKATFLAKAGTAVAQAVLLSDAKTGGRIDGPQDAWAQPVSALPVRDGVLSVSIADEQGKFNLNNFARKEDVNIQEEHIRQLRRLFERLAIDPNVTDSIVDWIDGDDEPRPFGAESAYYQGLPHPYWPKNGTIENVLDMFLIKGMTDDMVATIQPYITIYPLDGEGAININTAHRWVLETLHPQITPSVAERLVQARPFHTLFDVDRVGGMEEISKELRLRKAYQIHSEWFSIQSEGRIHETVKVARAVVNRQGTNNLQLVYYRLD
jgi:general secretion pathway protein K